MKTKIAVIIAFCAILTCTGVLAALHYFHRTPDETARILENTGKFSGVVSDATTGIPLPDARIVVLDRTGHLVQNNVISDDEGRFSIILPDGDYFIHAETPHYLSRQPNDQGREIHITAGTSFVNASLLLWPQAKLTGRIVNETIGIQAAVITTYESEDNQPFHYETVISNENGTFEITDIHEGIIRLEVAADGFARLQLDDIETRFGETVDLGDIPLKDGIALYGLVLDKKTHKPIPSVEVSILASDGQLLENVYTSNDGAYHMPPLDLTDVTVQFAAKGYSPVKQKIRFSGNSNREMNMVLSKNIGLVLNVQNQTGRPPENQSHVKITDISNHSVVFEETLANGTKTLNLTGGPYIVEAESPDGKTRQVQRVAAGDEVWIRLRPMARILAKATSRNGEPLTNGAYRYAIDPQCNGDWSDNPWNELAGDAQFELSELEEGCYRIDVKRHSDNRLVQSPELRLHNGDIRNLTIQMTEGGVLRGHVVSAGSGVNLRATVTLEGADNRSVTTDNNGYFTFDQLRNEPVTVVIRLNRENKDTRFENIVVKENETYERDFRVDSPRAERREQMRRHFEDMRERGELPTPPWGDGPPPWGDGPPPWMNNNGERQTPPWGDGPPPWGDGPPPWMNNNGERQTPPWGDGPPPWMNNNGERQTPPWGDGPPPWMNNNGERQTPPWGDGPPPWTNNNGERQTPPWGPHNATETSDHIIR